MAFQKGIQAANNGVRDNYKTYKRTTKKKKKEILNRKQRSQQNHNLKFWQ